MFRILFALILISLTTCIARADDLGSRVTRVELRSTVRLSEDVETITLGDLARIEGDQASRLESFVIDASEPVELGTWSIIPNNSIRKQIKDAQGINDGGIIVVGPDVRITRIKARVTNEDAIDSSAQVASEPEYLTLKKQLVRWTIARLDTSEDQSRFEFKDNDADDLNIPVAGRLVEIREIGRSEQLLLGVKVYENERLVLDRSFRFEVLLERPVRVATRQISRSSMITSKNSKIEHRWLGVTEPVASPSDAIGMITVSTIGIGRVIYTTSLEAPILIDRGQLVNARSIAGSVSISTEARAKQNGRLGDIIELESKDRSKQFRARVAGPGQVVIIKQNP